MSTKVAAAALIIGLIAALAACGESTSDSSAPGHASSGATNTSSQKASPPLGRGRQELRPGIHLLNPARRGRGGGALLPKIEITLPAGWFNFDGWAVSKGRRADRAFVTFWDVDRVYPTPCKWKYKPMVDPGRGVEGLASALARQPLRNATAPTDVVRAGFRGKYLQWSVPTDIAFDEAREDLALFPDCDEDTFQSWTARGWSSDRYQQAPGQVDRIWILNVNGSRLVIDASYFPDTTSHDRAELESAINSIRFRD